MSQLTGSSPRFVFFLGGSSCVVFSETNIFKKPIKIIYICEKATVHINVAVNMSFIDLYALNFPTL